LQPASTSSTKCRYGSHPKDTKALVRLSKSKIKRVGIFTLPGAVLEFPTSEISGTRNPSCHEKFEEYTRKVRKKLPSSSLQKNFFCKQATNGKIELLLRKNLASMPWLTSTMDTKMGQLVTEMITPESEQGFRRRNSTSKATEN
jgi:hypothetical protein